MKKIAALLVITAGLFSFYNTFSQNIVKVKLKNSQVFIKSKDIKSNEPIIIKIDSIHNLLYQVKLKINNYELYSEAPTLIKIFPGIDNSLNLKDNEGKDKDKDQYQLKNLSDTIKVIYAEILSIKGSLNRFYNHDSSICVRGLSSIRKKLLLDQDDDIISFLREKITFFKSNYEIIYQQSLNYDHVDSLIAKNISQSTSSYNYIKEIESDLIRGLEIILAGSKKKDSLVYTSTIHIPNGDLTNIEVVIVDRFKPKDTLSLNRFDLFIKNKFKVDFSLGLSSNNLVDKKYFFTYDGDNIKNGIDSENTNSLDFGLTAFLHLDWKIAKSFALGSVAGISISTIDTKSRYMIGIGGSFGKERTITISSGLSLGYMKELSKQISSDGKNYNQTDISRFEEVPMTSKLKTGYYFSLTYNLTRTRKKIN